MGSRQIQKERSQMFDQKTPLLLKKMQEWFGGAISRPLNEEDLIDLANPVGEKIEKESLRYILPSSCLTPVERVQIYNQQFWWRLLKILQEEYPLVLRLFGHEDFNAKIGVPYLRKYLPNHWSLAFLGNRLPLWIEQEYRAENQQLVLDAVCLDQAYNMVSIAEHHPLLFTCEKDGALSPSELEELMEKKAFLQPHLHLFSFDSDLFKLRNKLLQFDSEYREEKELLAKEKKYNFVLFRDFQNTAVHEEISPLESRLLQEFKMGSTIDDAINLLDQENEQNQRDAFEHLTGWLQKWIMKQWLFFEE